MAIDGLIWRNHGANGEGGTQRGNRVPGGEDSANDSIDLLRSVFQSRKLRANFSSEPNSKDRVCMEFAIAVGERAGKALDDIREMSIRRLGSGKSEMCVGTLILLLPELPSDCFRKPDGDKHYGREALVLNAVGRVVVLLCPHDLGLSTTRFSRVLGRDGAKAELHDKVELVDITALLDDPARARSSALSSCEVIGLITRLAQGMTVVAALGGGAAKLLPRPGKESE